MKPASFIFFAFAVAFAYAAWRAGFFDVILIWDWRTVALFILWGMVNWIGRNEVGN